MSDTTVHLTRGGEARVWTAPKDPDFALVEMPSRITGCGPDDVMGLRDALTAWLVEFWSRQPVTSPDYYEPEDIEL